MGFYTPPKQLTSTGAGTAVGTLPTANTAGVYVGMTGWLRKSDGTLPIEVEVSGITTAAVQLKRPRTADLSLLNLSSYDSGSVLQLDGTVVSDAVVATTTKTTDLRVKDSLTLLLGGGARHWFFDPLVTSADKTISGTVTRGLGYLRLDTGAGAAGAANAYWGASTAPNLIIPGGSGGVWAIATKFALSSAVDGNANLWVGASSAGRANNIRLGHIPGVTGLNFALLTDAGNIDTGVARDTAFHEWWVVRAGGITTIYMDGVAITQSALAYPNAPVGLEVSSNNGATAASRTIDVRWVAAMFDAL